ncbi:hypothetical protein ACNOYE_36790 [Nannocystaceae bacterium ST9]
MPRTLLSTLAFAFLLAACNDPCEDPPEEPEEQERAQQVTKAKLCAALPSR